ncbi:MAG: hypothetical protein H0U74_13030 [Bradymonadaceae bacterium]|nr:hypothetical protein [Lujinxingiaceae bacterium]
MTRYRERYEEIYGILSRAELQKGSLGLEALEAAPDLFGYDSDRWLGFYTLEGLEVALQRYGFFTDLNRLGFEQFRIEIRMDDPDEHLLRLWSTQPACDEPLIELVVRRNFLRATDELAERLELAFVPVLTVEWLLLQNPMAQFSPHRPPLPGQHHPGLGVGPQVLELLRNVCLRLKLAGITTVPSYFHNAVFYSGEFKHFDPFWQGAFLALCRDLIPRTGGSVCAASWALRWTMVRNELQEPPEPYPWFQELMLAPLSAPLKEYFAARDYQRDVQQSLTRHNFHLYEEALRQNLESKGIIPLAQNKVQQWVGEQP